MDELTNTNRGLVCVVEEKMRLTSQKIYDAVRHKLSNISLRREISDLKYDLNDVKNKNVKIETLFKQLIVQKNKLKTRLKRV